MLRLKSQFLISAPSSNSGKTTLTLGLLRALKDRGLTVQPFKCGPDYIDTIHHTSAAGKQSINLDTFMSSKEHVKAVYSHYSHKSEVSVTEGVMGLFDGAEKMRGSSAEIAELLNVPVILVVNARSMAYSAAPLLYGFKNFYGEIKVAGVIFNFVNTKSHYSFLQEASKDVGIQSLGYLPQNDILTIPSRHLGLHISNETNYEYIIGKLAEVIQKNIDVERLLDITSMPHSGLLTAPFYSHKFSNKDLKISIARDEAFTFTYHQNIDVLARYGKISWFSPLHDVVLPETDFLYLPGGYPELFAQKLSDNISMRESIRGYCQNGGLSFAECGGLMYLGNDLTTAEGENYKMTGVLDCRSSMRNGKVNLGYRVAKWNGVEMRGHEFHYSELEGTMLKAEIVTITNARGQETDTKLYRISNTFASYMHVYWGDNPEFIENLLAVNSTTC